MKKIFYLKFIFSLTLLLGLFITTTDAQALNITGKIVNSANQPIAGVNVSVCGGNSPAVADQCRTVATNSSGDFIDADHIPVEGNMLYSVRPQRPFPAGYAISSATNNQAIVHSSPPHNINPSNEQTYEFMVIDSSDCVQTGGGCNFKLLPGTISASYSSGPTGETALTELNIPFTFRISTNAPGGIKDATLVWTKSKLESLTSADCPGTISQGKYCIVGAQAPPSINMTQWDFTNNQTVFKVPGNYYITVNAGARNSEVFPGSDRIWCSSNPFCQYNNSTCPAGQYCIPCPGVAFCGANSYKQITINAAPVSPTPTSTSTPTPTPTTPLTPTPTPGSDQPLLTAPLSRTYTISDGNGFKPTFEWTQMLRPNTSYVRRMGVRVVKMSDNPNDSVTQGQMGCSDKIVIDRWWFDGATQAHNPNTAESTTNLRFCGDRQGDSSYPAAAGAETFAQAINNLNNLRNYTWTPEKGLSPGKYFVSVFNYDNNYRCDSNCTSPAAAQLFKNNSGYSTSYTFSVACPADRPWNGKSCGSTATKRHEVWISRLPAEDEPSHPLWSSGSSSNYWVDYTENPIPVTLPDDINPGTLLYVHTKFESDAGVKSQTFHKPFKFVGSDPIIENISCTYNSQSGVGSRVQVIGSNFGSERGSVKVISQQGSTDASIASWGEFLESTPSATLAPTGSQASSSTTVLNGRLASAGNVLAAQTGLKYKVVATIKERLEGAAQVELTTQDGRKARGYCGVNTTTVVFTSQASCQPPGNASMENARVQIYESLTPLPSKPLYDFKKVSLDQDGIPQGVSPKLEVGKSYILVVKGPKTVAVAKKFTVEDEGTVNLDLIRLPIGDIAPVNTPDNTINSLDKSELAREWVISQDAQRTGDFNSDNRVNSIDYSCMKENFNRQGERFLQGQ